jgi:curved DNA-binding protein CbpA
MAKPYQVLGVDPRAGEAAINTAFRKAVKECHPDLHGNDPAAARRFRRLVAAREILTNPGRRFLYRHSGARQSLIFETRGQRKSIAAAAAAMAGIAALLIITFIIQGWKSAPSVGPFQTAVFFDESDEEISDAGSAEIKAIRDIREALGAESLRDDTSMSGNSGLPRRAVKPRPAQYSRTMRAAVSRFSKSLRVLASRLNGT